MKALLNFLLVSLVIYYLVSCVSLQDRTLSVTDKNETEIIGSVKTEFVSGQEFNIINKERISGQAYIRLLNLAKSQYGSNVDIRNIKITGGFSGLEVLLLAAGPIASNLGFLTGVGIAGGGISDIYGSNAIPGIKRFVIGASLISIPFMALSGNYQKITATGDVVSIR